MYILEIDDVSQAFLTLVGKFLNIIHIAVPILLIVLVSLDLAKAVISQDDEMISHAVHSIKNRVIAALLVFLVPTFVDMLFTRVSISLNVDQNKYNEILSTYKSVIYSDKINVIDQSKNNDILSESKYVITDTNSTDNLEDERDLVDISKMLTPILFSKEKSSTFIKTFTTDDFSINYNNKTYNANSKLNISYKNMKINEVIDNGNHTISTITLEDCFINNNQKYKNIIINYYYQKQNDIYKLEKVGIDSKEEVTSYNEEISKNEVPKEIVATDKYISKNIDYDYSKLNTINSKDIEQIYKKNSSNVVIVKAYYNSAVVNRAMGFFISDGVIATSYSFIQYALMSNRTIIINDIKASSYKIDGIVSIDTNNDIIVLKLDKLIKSQVSFGNKDNMKKNDPVFTITSKTGVGLSSISGIISSVGNDFVNVLPLSKNDGGSVLLDREGKVIGINTTKLIESELSNASSINGLINLQKELNNTNFNDIRITPLKEFKSKYFYKQQNKEEIKANIPNKIWKKYKKFGDIENTIALDLVKASYYDKVLSLRYINNTYNYIDNMEYSSDFVSSLKNKGYKMEFSSLEKLVYRKGKNKVIIMSEFDYLIVVLVKGTFL